jgi:serine/threonine protein kinase
VRHHANGFFSEVYEAIDQTSEEKIAIKALKLHNSAEALAEFRNEGYLLDELASASHVLDLAGPPENQFAEDVSSASGAVRTTLTIPFLVLEWMDQSVGDLLVHRGDLPWSERLDLFRHISKGVHQMHLRAIFHRDLKCRNTLVRAERKIGYVVKVSDLGRSRRMTALPLGPAGSYEFGRGDMGHAPPECLFGLGSMNDHGMFMRADLYLLGSIFYELATASSITSAALGDPRRLIHEAGLVPVEDRPGAYLARANELRSQYNTVVTLFVDELPLGLRHEGGRLLRQLCDPLPALRDNIAQRAWKRSEPGLGWLLRRIDILRHLVAPPTFAGGRPNRMRRAG